jgi:hypothetical protein
MPADLWAITEVEENINGTVEPEKPHKVVKHLVSYRDTLSDDDSYLYTKP